MATFDQSLGALAPMTRLSQYFADISSKGFNSNFPYSSVRGLTGNGRIYLSDLSINSDTIYSDKSFQTPPYGGVLPRLQGGSVGLSPQPRSNYIGRNYIDISNGIVAVIHYVKLTDYLPQATKCSILSVYAGGAVIDRQRYTVGITGMPCNYNTVTHGASTRQVHDKTDYPNAVIVTGIDLYYGDTPRVKATSNLSLVYKANFADMYGVRRDLQSGQYSATVYSGSDFDVIIPIVPSRQTVAGFVNLARQGNFSYTPETGATFAGWTSQFLYYPSMTIGVSKVSIDGSWRYPAANDDNFVPAPYRQVGMCVHNINNDVTFLSSGTPISTTTGSYISPDVGNNVLVFEDLDAVTEMLADFGITVAPDANTAINMPVEIIDPGYVPPGIPTNPTPIMDSYPDNTSDDIDITPPLLSYSLTTSLHVLTAQSSVDVMQWILGGSFYDNLSKLFNDPLSAVGSLRYYPFDIVTHDPTHTVLRSSTTIANVTSNDIQHYDMLERYSAIISGGTLHYTAYYGNFADYESCKYQLYVPYLGVVDVPPSMAVNSTLSIQYLVDFLTGTAQVVIMSQAKGDTHKRLVETKSCPISVEIPIAFDNYNDIMRDRTMSVISGITSLMGSAVGGATSIATGVASLNPAAVISGAQSIAGGLINSAMDVGKTFATTPLEIGVKGSIGSNSGYLLPQTPYLIVAKKPLALPADGYSAQTGSPSSYYGVIGEGVGYVRCEQVMLDFPALETVKQKIAEYLASGVYL